MVLLNSTEGVIARVALRFIKGFVSGGLAAIVTISPLSWSHSLVAAFITGGLLAVEKLYTETYGNTQTITAQAQVPVIEVGTQVQAKTPVSPVVQAPEQPPVD